MPRAVLRSAISVLSFVLSLAALSQPPPQSVQNTIVEARDLAGRSLGSFVYLPRDARNPPRSDAAFLSPDGRRLDIQFASSPGRTVAVFREKETVFQVTLYQDFFGKAGFHFPLILSLGSENLFVSVPSGSEEKAKALPDVRRETSRWVKTKDPKLHEVLRQAFDWASYSMTQSAPAPILEGFLRGAQGLWNLYYVCTPPPDHLQLRLETPAHVDASRIALQRPSGSFRQLAAPHRESDSMDASVRGSRDEELGRLQVRWPLQGTSDVAGNFVVLTFTSSAKPRTVERLAVGETGVAGEILCKLQRQSGEDWKTLLGIQTIAGGSGPSWYEPWIVADGAGRRTPFEIPPAGDAPRRIARRRLLDGIASALVVAGLDSRAAAQTLWHWGRLLEQPEVTAAFPPLEKISDLAGELAAPQFEDERGRAWLGSIRLVVDKVVTHLSMLDRSTR